MPLILHDTLATATFVYPLKAGWVEATIPVELREDVRAGMLAERDLALIPAAEIALLAETHRVVPEVAVVAGAVSGVVMRTPVRPDEVERTPVRLWHVSGAAEVLARATLQPFYGITPTAWTVEDTAEAQVAIVDGVEALRPPEAGFAEDLGRAWFILTGLPTISHLLVAPKDLERDAIRPELDLIEALRTTGHARRRELRHELAEAHRLDEDRVAAFLGDQRLSLGTDDRRALLALLQRGGRGSIYPPLSTVAYLEPPAR